MSQGWCNGRRMCEVDISGFLEEAWAEEAYTTPKPQPGPQASTSVVKDEPVSELLLSSE